MDNKTTISFNSQYNDMMTGGAQAACVPPLILFSFCPPVPSVFKQVRLSRLFLLTLLLVD